MSKCFIMVGMPGVGKSHYISKHFGGKHVYSTDNRLALYAELHDMTYDEYWSKEHFALAESIENESLKTAIEIGKDIVWDQTNLGEKKRKKIIDKMREAGYKVHCIHFKHPEDQSDENFPEWIRRLNYRSEREGKTIPANVLINMIKTYQEPNFEEGFDSLKKFDLWGKELT